MWGSLVSVLYLFIHVTCLLSGLSTVKLRNDQTASRCLAPAHTCGIHCCCMERGACNHLEAAGRRSAALRAHPTLRVPDAGLCSGCVSQSKIATLCLVAIFLLQVKFNVADATTQASSYYVNFVCDMTKGLPTWPSVELVLYRTPWSDPVPHKQSKSESKHL